MRTSEAASTTNPGTASVSDQPAGAGNRPGVSNGPYPGAERGDAPVDSDLTDARGARQPHWCRERISSSSVGREDATVGDLLDSLPGGADARGVVIDGRFFHVDLALAEIGLYEGARIAPPTARRGPPTNCSGRRSSCASSPALTPGGVVPLRSRGVVAGRDPECDLVLTDEGVSRRHLSIVPSQGGLRATVTDLDSVNGTWVEGRRIRRADRRRAGGDVRGRRRRLHVAAPAMPLPVDPVRQANIAGTIAFNRPAAPAARARGGSDHRARGTRRAAEGALLDGLGDRTAADGRR